MLKIRNKICSLIVSLIISLMSIIGFQYHHGNYQVFNSMYVFIVLGLLFLIIYLWNEYSWNKLSDSSTNNNPISSASSPLFKRSDIISLVFILIAWTPCYLASFPGFFCYDATVEFNSIYHKSYLEIHPILHSLILTKCLTLFHSISNDYNLGIAVFCIFQIIMGALIFLYIAKFIYRITFKKWLYILILLFFAFCPPIVLFAGCTTKDVSSGLFILLYLVRFYDYFFLVNLNDKCNKKRRVFHQIFLCVLGVITLHSKKNVVLAFLIFFISQLFIKKNRKERLCLMVVQLLLFWGLTSFLRIVLPTTPDDIHEALSIPGQQIAAVYTLEGRQAFTDQEWKSLESFFPVDELKDNYCPQLADPIKFRIRDDAIKAKPFEALSLWITLGIKHPKAYIYAFFVMTYQAWYPFTDINGYNTSWYEYQGSDTCYFACTVEPPGTLHSILPKLYEKIFSFSLFESVYRIPVIGLFCTIGFYIWFFIYTLGYVIYSKQYTVLSFLMFPLAFLFTNLLGPIVLVRYYLFFIYSFPLMLCILLHSRQTSDHSDGDTHS